MVDTPMLAISEEQIDLSPEDLEKNAYDVIEKMVDEEKNLDIIKLCQSYQKRMTKKSKENVVDSIGSYINYPTSHDVRLMNQSGLLACERFMKTTFNNETLAMDGINIAWCYLGTNYTSFPLHLENLKFYAINVQVRN